MSSEQWRQIEEWFGLAAEAEPEEREEMLRGAPEEVRAEVWRLMAGLERAAEFLESTVGEARRDYEAEPNEEGTLAFGPWRVTGIVGQGGMATVYRVVREDGGFRQDAAAKVLHLGLSSDWAKERFRRERSILAELHHPNIATLLDGGETPDGLPYLVMEYIDGLPITEYAERKALGRRQRLELFQCACAAVEAAHARLIVHRDLKPANILVDAYGAPKLLDFGIAKLLDGERDLTRTEGRAYTPAYASPEQIRGGSGGTATDVYGLGLVLYELLAGRRAFPTEGKAAREVEVAICERGAEAPGVSPELDRIMMMALRREPERRYPGPRELAEDLQRVIESRPVKAMPDSWLYRAERYLVRNRWRLAAAGLVAALASLGVGATLYQARRAEARFQQVRNLSSRLLTEFYPEISQLPGGGRGREKLLEILTGHLDQLIAQARQDPELRRELARNYMQLAEIESSFDVRNLGKPMDAMRHWRIAESLFRGLQDAEAIRDHARVLSRMGLLDWEEGRVEEALRKFGESGRQSERLRRLGVETEAARAVRQSNENRIADVEMSRGHLAAARMVYENGEPDVNERMRMARLMRLVDLEWYAGNLEAARKRNEEYRALAEHYASGEPGEGFAEAHLHRSRWNGARLACGWPWMQGECREARKWVRELLAREYQAAKADGNDFPAHAMLWEHLAEAEDFVPLGELRSYFGAGGLSFERLRQSRLHTDRMLAAQVGVLRSRLAGEDSAEALQEAERVVLQSPGRLDLVLTYARMLRRVQRRGSLPEWLRRETSGAPEYRVLAQAVACLE
jgi:hypothetical protein